MNISHCAALACALVPSVALAGSVDLSSDGMCYCPGSDLADDKNVTTYPSLNACLASGGRAARQGQGECETVIPGAPLGRPEFLDRITLAGRDENGGDHLFQILDDDDPDDCRDARQGILAALSIEPVTYSVDGCEVVSGNWVDPYTGQTHLEPTDLIIDHLVPLTYAWEFGAKDWPEETRRRFANDPANVFMVDAEIGHDKQASSPIEWLPADEKYRCNYALSFAQLVAAYDLELPHWESNGLSNLIGDICR